MYSVGRTPRPRLSIEPPRQMADRLRVQLNRIAPSHPSLLLPFDAFLVDILEDSIKEVEQAKADSQPQQDFATQRQQQKASELKQRYHERWMTWKSMRNECRRISGLKSQQIMGLLPVGFDSDEPRQISLNVSDALIFSSPDQGKRFCDELEFELWQLEARVDAMRGALAFAAEDHGEQGKQMAAKVYDDVQALTERVAKLEEVCRLFLSHPANKPKRKVA